MIEANNLQELRERCSGTTIFPRPVLDWIARENLWNIWVPRNYGGLELPLTKGLSKLQELARIDGSLGWTVTLCSGANYFIGNLEPLGAQEIFLNSTPTVILGGSGGVLGIAEKAGDYYKISGKWKYATGAPYLSHFTLNAEVHENGRQLQLHDGSPKVLSFVLPREKVRITEDWNAMGLKASATHSFEVENVLIHSRFSFEYNRFYQEQDIFKIPFSVFADLTLWVNYVGMAEHFFAEASGVTKNLKNLENIISGCNSKTAGYAQEIEAKIANAVDLTPCYIDKIHKEASDAVRELSLHIIKIYPYLGVKASRNDNPLNQIFCDYFTATQHHIFSR